MAEVTSSVPSEEVNDQIGPDLEDWEYAKQGIRLWLNNQPFKAEEFVQQRLDKTQVLTSYAFIMCINGVISYEMDKIEEAQGILKELEQRCASDAGWLKSFRSMIFGSSGNSGKSLTKQLEDQIILADSILCSAILTFLTQDLSGFMKGTWLLKKAWKVYQHAYNQIYNLYKDVIGVNDIGHFVNISSRKKSDSTSTINSGSSVDDWSVPNSSTESVNEQNHYQHPRGLVQSVSEYLLSAAGKKRKSKSRLPRSKSSDIKTKNSTSLNNPSTHELNGKSVLDQNHNSTDIDPETVKRLMGAVSFGFGAFQLSVSLLPPSMLKLVSFFGFEGDREAGLTCLKHSRTTQDMRAPLSTIALLWYLTIGSQIFANDDQDLEAEIQEVQQIINESEEYSESALFLFFKGRLERMKREMKNAINYFEQAYYVSVLPELRLLCLHELGWCRLIELDCENAIHEFHALRLNSQFSKSFFVYLTALCHGASGQGIEDLPVLKSEIFLNISQSPQKESQIDKFLLRRYEQMPESGDNPNKFEPIYWRYFVYEMLFLWNALDICSNDVLDKIALDCGIAQEEINEPILGLGKLVLGACETYRGNFDKAVEAYRDCLRYRVNQDSDPEQPFAHISAFASFKLATLLMKYFNKKDEARQLLLSAQQKYKNYDFESRLSVRIHGALKQL